MECSPQSLSIAFVDIDLVAPVTVVLIVVKRHHLSVAHQLICTGTSPRLLYVDGRLDRQSASKHGGRRYDAPSPSRLYWTVLVEQTGQNVASDRQQSASSSAHRSDASRSIT